MSDLFVSQGISPMLLQKSEPFDSKDYIFELKLDGFRCIAYIGDGRTVLKSRNNKDITHAFPELTNMHYCVKRRCVLDGEIVCLKKGKPDFSALQRRSFFKTESKIKAAVSKTTAQFVAFDILYLENKTLFTIPQIKRKAVLSKTVNEGFNLSISRYVEEKGMEFFNLVKAQNLEGVVAKRKNGQYFAGKRTAEWLKIKAQTEEDFLICGILFNESQNIKSLILGRLDKNGKMRYAGRVNVASKNHKTNVANFAKNNAVKTPWFTNFKGAVWVKPSLKATVNFLNKTEGKSLRHPVLKCVNFIN